MMMGPGSVVAGLAPPQDNPPAVAFIRAANASPQPTGDAKGISGEAAPAKEGEDGDENAESPFIGNALAGYIWSSWSRNKRARDIIENRLLACLRARRGIYAVADTQTMWTDGAGDPIYLAYAATKMRQAEGALRDLLLPDGDRPWGLNPSPIPELPEEVEASILQDAAAQARQQMTEMSSQPGGKTMSGDQFRAVALKLKETLRDRVLEVERKEARERSERMEQAIEERMERGAYYQAMAEYVQHFATYPTAILKGPFLKRSKRLKWPRKGGGVPVVSNAADLTWTAVNPFDCFPAPQAQTCQDGDFIERIRMTRADLYECIGTPGYNEAAIRNVLATQQNGGLRAWLWSDAERRMIEGSTHDVWIEDYLVDAIHFWGSVEGKTLIEYGLTEGVEDQLAYYEVDAVLIGSDVIRCEINDDPLGRRPYFNASYDPVPGAFWGNAIYELMADCQAMINGAARALNANLGLASGPIMGIDMSQLAAGQDPKAIRPLQVLQLDRSRAQAAASPIEWYQAKSNAAELLGIIDKFKQESDDLTGIPRYTEGAAQASGAAGTFGGLSMLLAQAAKGFRRAVAEIDRCVISPTVDATFTYEMLYNPDDTIKGDCTVEARGAAAVLIKEHLQQTRGQFLAATNNPTDMQIIGLSGRRAVLKESAKALDMPIDDVVGTDQEWRQKTEQAQQQPPQPKPDAVLKAQTDLKREHIKSATALAKEGLIHPHAAAIAQEQQAALAPPGANDPGQADQMQAPQGG